MSVLHLGHLQVKHFSTRCFNAATLSHGPSPETYTCIRTTIASEAVLLPLPLLQLLFPVLGLEQEASPHGLRDSDSTITINVFDEVVTPTAAAKAMRAVARTGVGSAGECCEMQLCWMRLPTSATGRLPA